MQPTITGIKKIPYDVDGNKGFSYELLVVFSNLPFTFKVKAKGGTEAILYMLVDQFENDNKK